jgi:threonine dehydratase
VLAKTTVDATAMRQKSETSYATIARYLRPTPLAFSPYFSQRTGINVWFKPEHLQVTGSFKARGAFAKLMRNPGASVIAASTGNHGLAVAHAARTLGNQAEIFVPKNVSPAKMAALHTAGARLCILGEESGETERLARAAANQDGRLFVSPYNDEDVIAGQGTIGIEIEQELANLGHSLEQVYIALGGGGLASGIAASLKAGLKGKLAVRAPEIIAVSAENDCVMHQSVQKATIVPYQPQGPTLADGAAGGLEPEAITLHYVAELCDVFMRLEEPAIAAAMKTFIQHEAQLIEGTAALALAGLLQRYRGAASEVYPAPKSGVANAVVILCGGRVTTETLTKVLSG